MNKTNKAVGIVRLEPGDGQFTAEYIFPCFSGKVYLEYHPLNCHENSVTVFQNSPEGRGSFHIENLLNECDYQICAYTEKDGEKTAESIRLIRCGCVPGRVINYIHPDDPFFSSSGRFPASPSLLQLPGGGLLASHDIFEGNGGQNLTLVFRSDDRGETWNYVSEIYPCFWGKLFLHRNKVFILSESTEYGNLLIYESADEGKTWSEPAVLMKGGSREKGGPHKAPVPVISCNGRLWTDIDYGSWQTGGHASGAASVSTDSDIMNPENWVFTGFVKQDSSWKNVPEGEARGTLEGNIVQGKDGELYDILRYQHDGCKPAYGKAVILKLDKNNPSAKPEFFRIIDFPGNLSKFDIYYDEKTDCYYSLVNRVTGENIYQRNVLSLTYSENLTDWKLKKDVLNFENCGYHEDSEKVGFQYADFIFDKQDILFVSRTAVNNAENYHNSNHITFHCIENYKC